MKELVGTCKTCGKDIYCLDGFFNGIHTKDQEIYCFDCYENMENKEENPQS